MIQNKICLVAEGIIRDAESNNISVYNIIEQITGEGFPLFIQKMAFFTLWEKKSSDPTIYEAVFTIKLNTITLISKNISIDFEDKLRNRNIVSINALLIPKPGILTFNLKANDRSRAVYKIKIDTVGSAVQAS